MTVEEARGLIVAGARLLLAGDEALLRALPRGNWIGGTTPYFMASQGGLETKQLVMVTRLPDEVVSASSVIYAPDSLSQIPADYPANGVSFIVLPAGSAAHNALLVTVQTGPLFSRLHSSAGSPATTSRPAVAQRSSTAEPQRSPTTLLSYFIVSFAPTSQPRSTSSTYSSPRMATF